MQSSFTPVASTSSTACSHPRASAPFFPPDPTLAQRQTHVTQAYTRSSQGQTHVTQSHSRSSQGQAHVTQAHSRSSQGQALVTQAHSRSSQGQAHVKQAHSRSSQGQAHVKQAHSRSSQGQAHVTQAHSRSSQGQASQPQHDAHSPQLRLPPARATTKDSARLSSQHQHYCSKPAALTAFIKRQESAEALLLVLVENETCLSGIHISASLAHAAQRHFCSLSTLSMHRPGHEQNELGPSTKTTDDSSSPGNEQMESGRCTKSTDDSSRPGNEQTGSGRSTKSTDDSSRPGNGQKGSGRSTKSTDDSSLLGNGQTGSCRSTKSTDDSSRPGNGQKGSGRSTKSTSSSPSPGNGQKGSGPSSNTTDDSSRPGNGQKGSGRSTESSNVSSHPGNGQKRSGPSTNSTSSSPSPGHEHSRSGASMSDGLSPGEPNRCRSTTDGGVSPGDETQQQLREFLMRQLHAKLASCRGQSVANSMWALASMKQHPGPGLMEALLDRSMQVMLHFNAQELSNTLYSLAVLHERPSFSWLHAFCVACSSRWSTFKSYELSVILWSLASLGVAIQSPSYTSTEYPDDANDDKAGSGSHGSNDLETDFLQERLVSSNHAGPVSSDRVAAGVGKHTALGISQVWLLSLLSAQAPLIPDSDQEALACSLWALGKMRAKNLSASWVRHIVHFIPHTVQRMSSFELANTMWGVAECWVELPDDLVLDLMARCEAEARKGSYATREVVALLHAASNLPPHQRSFWMPSPEAHYRCWHLLMSTRPYLSVLPPERLVHLLWVAFSSHGPFKRDKFPPYL
eukprot:gene6597-3252_t